MKTTSEIIAYLEGRQAELEKQDPRPRDVYVIAELLAYIKSGKPSTAHSISEILRFPDWPTTSTPCYAPNGICTNPQMDCINCPKRNSSAGRLTTTSGDTQ